MLKLLKKWINDVFTEPDGKTMCPVRVLAVGGFVYFLSTHAFSVYAQHSAFDLSSFGSSFAMMIATVGAALGLKSDAPVAPNVVQPS